MALTRNHLPQVCKCRCINLANVDVIPCLGHHHYTEVQIELPYSMIWSFLWNFKVYTVILFALHVFQYDIISLGVASHNILSHLTKAESFICGWLCDTLTVLNNFIDRNSIALIQADQIKVMTFTYIHATYYHYS